jgi:hypothetical protein
MTTPFQPPNAERIKAACAQFDKAHELADKSLAELFRQYPNNSDPRHVLLKVAAIDSLYHTCVFALDEVARHIAHNIEGIDAALAAGSPEVVGRIAHVVIQGRKYNFLSFATKFCHWHNPHAYPIYDSRVDHYLCALQQQTPFTAFQHAELLDYPRFCEIMIAFRDFHGLGSFTFREIDKFFLFHGAPPANLISDENPSNLGAFDFFPGNEPPDPLPPPR